MNEDQVRAKLGKYDAHTQAEAIKEVLRNKYKASLYLTAKDLLEYDDISRPTHEGIISALEAPTKRKLIVVPRGCFKSSIGVVSYSIQSLFINPNLRILIDSELYENSKNFIREVRGKLELPRVVALFGDSRGDQWSEGSITIKQRTRVLKEASITAGGVGTGKVGQHYDLVIMDDLNSNRNSQTPEQCRKVIEHYKLTTSILEPEGTMVIIGTRYSAADTIGYVIETEILPQGLISENLQPIL